MTWARGQEKVVHKVGETWGQSAADREGRRGEAAGTGGRG